MAGLFLAHTVTSSHRMSKHTLNSNPHSPGTRNFEPGTIPLLLTGEFTDLSSDIP
jgi:hypothetical protein